MTLRNEDDNLFFTFNNGSQCEAENCVRENYRQIKVLIEIPGLSKEKIKVDAYEDKVEVKGDDPQRKYHKIVVLPPETDIESARCAYNNGILEITFNKKKYKQRRKERQ